MEEQIGKAPTTSETSDTFASARSVLYDCGDGVIVTSPKDCHTNGYLPPIDTSNLSKT